MFNSPPPLFEHKILSGSSEGRKTDELGGLGPQFPDMRARTALSLIMWYPSSCFSEERCHLRLLRF